jgi:microcystin-dependent protein
MFQFPPNPTLGQQFAPAQGVAYEWNGTGWISLGLSTASLYPAGIIMPYAGAAPLPFQGWLLCDGASYATSAQPALFAVIGYTYGGGAGSFNVPDLRGRVVAGVDAGAGRLGASMPGTLAASGGAEGVTLTTTTMAPHAHSITDVAHGHGIADPTHAHGVYDPGHAHGVSDPWHGHYVNDPGHNHAVNDGGHQHDYQRARSQGNQKPASGGTAPYDDHEMAQTDWRGSNISISGSGTNISLNTAPTGIGIHGAGTSIGIYGAGTGISIYGSGTGLSTTNAAGSGGAHNNVQPTLVLNYIIKA